MVKSMQSNIFLFMMTMVMFLHAKIELSITTDTNNYRNTTCIHSEHTYKKSSSRRWKDFAKQIIASYGACYATKTLYRLIAISNPQLAENVLIQLLFGYIGWSTSDDVQVWLTDNSNIMATVLGAIFALSTDAPDILYKKIAGCRRR